LLRQADGADAEHLAGEQDLRTHAGDHDLGDARHLFLEHAAQHVLAVDHDREVKEERDTDREERADLSRAAAPLLRDPLGRHADPRARDRLHHSWIGAGLAELVEHHRLADGVADALDVAKGRGIAPGVARRHPSDSTIVEHEVTEAAVRGHHLARRRRLGVGEPRRLDDSHLGLCSRRVAGGVGAEPARRRRGDEVGGDAVAKSDAGRVEDDDVAHP
jgi:hypothetical protein